MGTGTLTIDLDAVVQNWRALDALSGAVTRTGAVVKADAYGLGAVQVSKALAAAGTRDFFVATAEEGVTVRKAVGPGPEISVFSGHMDGDAERLQGPALTPMLNSAEQVNRHLEALPDHPFGIQLDSGMNRLGMEAEEWKDMRDRMLARGPRLIMSHMGCADEPDHPMNLRQLTAFTAMTDGVDVPRSLSATAGLLLGPDYHFDLTRPGIGLYGGWPFTDAAPVLRLSLPVIQLRTLEPGETVGYGNAWQATGPSLIATLSAGYADGLIRFMGGRTWVYAGERRCPLVGRVSMDLLTVDVTELRDVPDSFDILCPEQGIDDIAAAAGTIGHEILTSLGTRYRRDYVGGAS